MTELLQMEIFSLVLTLTVFRIGQLCQKKWKLPLFNPTLIGMILLVAFLLLTGVDPEIYQAGAARISWLMTPATICLAIPMYEQFQVLKKNLKAIVVGVAAGALVCAGGLMLCGIALGLPESVVISLMPKSVTTAIGVPLSELFGGMGGVTTAAIIVTGITANMMGTTFCKWFGITHPVAQGAAFGTAGHVIGTAKASELGELAGAVSSLSLVTAGLLTALIFPILINFLT